MSDCDKNEVYPSKLAKMSEFRHIFSQATLWVDIAFYFLISTCSITFFLRKPADGYTTVYIMMSEAMMQRIIKESII